MSPKLPGQTLRLYDLASPIRTRPAEIALHETEDVARKPSQILLPSNNLVPRASINMSRPSDLKIDKGGGFGRWTRKHIRT